MAHEHSTWIHLSVIHLDFPDIPPVASKTVASGLGSAVAARVGSGHRGFPYAVSCHGSRGERFSSLCGRGSLRSDFDWHQLGYIQEHSIELSSQSSAPGRIWCCLRSVARVAGGPSCGCCVANESGRCVSRAIGALHRWEEWCCVGGLGGAAFDACAVRMGSGARRGDEECCFPRVARTKRPLHPWLHPCAPSGRRWACDGLVTVGAKVLADAVVLARGVG